MKIWYWVYEHIKDKKEGIEEYSMLRAIFGSEKDANKYKKEKEKETKGVKWDFEVTYFIEKKDSF